MTPWGNKTVWCWFTVTGVVVSALASINKINQRRARLVTPPKGGWPYPGSIPSVGHLSRYVTSHPGQISLAITSWVGAMSTSQRVVTCCGWGVNAGMVRVWVVGKTVRSPCYTRAIYLSASEIRSLCIKCYKACKLFNISFYATLCFNYFRWHRCMTPYGSVFELLICSGPYAGGGG